jgi:lactocepin
MALARALAPHVSSAPSGAGSTVYVKSLAIHRAWPSGFVRTVDIAWSKGPASTGVSGTTIRAALGLRSTKFFINARGGRLQGSGRYAEAVAASARLFPSAGNAKSAIVVNGDDEHYADIACAVALSGVAKGPVLFVKSGSVPSNVNSEIRRLGVKKLYIVGGTTAVSAGVTAQLASLVPDTERLGGADRYKTAAIVARKAVALGASSSQAVLCAGSGWSDAAVAAALAGGAKRPLLLTAKSSLPGSTASALTDLKVTRTTLVARADAVTTSTIAQVCAITGEHAVAKRIGATGDRYDIAASAASWSVSSLGYSTSTIYVASGRAISDAFITAGFAARLKHPMLLTDTYTPSDAATSYLLGAVSARTSVTIVGGQSAVGIACALQLQSDGH